MFDEENEMKDAEEYRGKMERLAADCKEGNVGAISCHHAAEFFTMVDKNYHKSHEIYKMNCDRYKYAASCFEVATAFLANRGVQPITAPASVAPGLGGMKISLDKATGLASGTDLDDGTVPFTSPQQQLEQENKAVDYLEKACERKHFGGCHILGKLYYSRAHSRAEPGVPAPPGTPAENLQKGLTMLEKSCKYSYGESCSYLGMHHLRKDLYKLDARDPPKAVGFLTKACDQCNNINACYNLAVLLNNGDTGVPRDAVESQKWQRKTLELQKQQSVDMAARKLNSSGSW